MGLSVLGAMLRARRQESRRPQEAEIDALVVGFRTERLGRDHGVSDREPLARSTLARDDHGHIRTEARDRLADQASRDERGGTAGQV